jgi:enterochelin esterase-like enzyme
MRQPEASFLFNFVWPPPQNKQQRGIASSGQRSYDDFFQIQSKENTMSARFIMPSPRVGPFILGPDAQRQADVPRGTVTQADWRSTIFPGTVRHYYVYVPAQYTPDSPAHVMIFQDGGADPFSKKVPKP